MDAWNVADKVGWQLFKAWLAALLPFRPFFVNLYTNVMTPPLSLNFGDYLQPTPSQWPSYGSVQLDVPNWTEPQTTDHVTQIAQPAPAVFTLPLGQGPISIAGYVVCDTYLNYLWSYQFSTPLVLNAPATAQFVVQFNIGVMPVS